MYRLFSIGRLIPVIAIASLLAACGEPSDVVTICENDNALCQDLNSDQWCQRERDSLITARFHLKQNETEQTQYSLLTSLNTYQECIKIAALIEPRTHPELKTQRVSAMLSTYDELLALEKKTLKSNNPYILNYHWVTHNNEAAKRRFIALSKKQSFDDPVLYFAIANIYDNNTDKATVNLLKGIRLLGDDHEMTTKLIYGLITAYMHQRNYDLAYLWSHVAIILEVENINLTLFTHNKISQIKKTRLEVLATRIAEQIEDQEFTDESYQYILSSVSLIPRLKPVTYSNKG
ncbi:DUF2989 domain-containing protein [Moritella sp. 36]|uniref:DUF2989 domain-containing protein n=1 Tax=Moritella sp. 36 TaxID=2746233 RepID=UPI001BA69F4E|nr:DUF2989 domain-containing protein [Moritella sp. 36]QUM88249.1 DUF2989 domain-containing protein [Moritella sp. 36]